MCRILIAGLLLCSTVTTADEKSRFALAAPDGWGGETIKLPPGFARDMKWTGVEHIRFAPGMQAGSETFFCYAFVFELDPKSDLTSSVVKQEFLKYYRGLSKAVLNGKLPDLDTSKFSLDLAKRVSKSPFVNYTGVLRWVEPFASKKKQLNVEIQTWKRAEKNYVFACVSPQDKDAAIWKQLHQIRDDYLKLQQ